MPNQHWWTIPLTKHVSRSFLKRPGSPNIPIQAIGLSLYESLGSDVVEEPGTKVTRTQWLDLSSLEMANLIGKNVLIVDEVDDTRTTLEYCIRELQKDVEEATKRLGREAEKTVFSIFVLHVSRFCKEGRGWRLLTASRTRTSRRRASCQRRWRRNTISRRGRRGMCGYVIPGKRRKFPLVADVEFCGSAGSYYGCLCRWSMSAS